MTVYTFKPIALKGSQAGPYNVWESALRPPEEDWEVSYNPGDSFVSTFVPPYSYLNRNTAILFDTSTLVGHDLVNASISFTVGEPTIPEVEESLVNVSMFDIEYPIFDPTKMYYPEELQAAASSGIIDASTPGVSYTHHYDGPTGDVIFVLSAVVFTSSRIFTEFAPTHVGFNSLMWGATIDSTLTKFTLLIETSDTPPDPPDVSNVLFGAYTI